MGALILKGDRGRYIVNGIETSEALITLSLLEAEAVTVRLLRGRELFVRFDYSNGTRLYMPCIIDGEEPGED